MKADRNRVAALVLALMALTLAAHAQTTPTLVWADEFTTSAPQLSASDWADPGAGSINAAGYAVVTGQTFGLRNFSWGETYTIDLGMRIPSASQPLEGDRQPIACESTTDTLNSRFQFYTSGTSLLSQTMRIIRSHGGSEVQHTINFFNYFSNVGLLFQDIRIVIGPGLQRVYINGSLVHQSAVTRPASELWALRLAGCGQAKPVHFNHIRIYKGTFDDPALVWRDDFNATKPFLPIEEDWYADTGRQLQSGTGYLVGYKFGKYPRIPGDAYYQKSAQLDLHYANTYTLDFYVRFPYDLTKASDIIVGGARNPGGASTPPWFYVRNGTKALFYAYNIGAGQQILVDDLTPYLTGDRATDWQSFRLVIGAAKQSLYINGELVCQTVANLTSSARWVPFFEGNDSYRFEMDKIVVWSGDQEAVPVNAVPASQWAMYD